MDFNDVQRFTLPAHYSLRIEWKRMKSQLEDFAEETSDMDSVQLNPDFQRGHVWTEEQQIAYVEFALRGGETGRDVYFNHPGWMGSWKGDFVLVDGLQRVTAVTRFMNNEIKAFGSYHKEFTGRMKDVYFNFHVNNLKTRKEVLRWYLEMNTGGVVHTDEEISRVEKLMEES